MRVTSIIAVFLSFLQLSIALGGNATRGHTHTAGSLRGGKGTNATAHHHPRVTGKPDEVGRQHNDSRRKHNDPIPLSSEASPGLFEGDIVPDYETINKAYGPKVAQELEEEGLMVKNNSTLRQAAVNRRWTTRVNGVVQVPYTFAGQHDANAIAVIENALKDLGDRSKVIKFVRRTSEVDYLVIISGSGCWSYVGKQGGRQELSLKSSGCVTHGIVQHEFLHALGFEHEQSRPDRDGFVRINYENIAPAMAYNFDKRTGSDSLGSPYDYGSVMHYGKTDFSVNGRDTITAPQSIGQRGAADAEDVRQVILLYQCVSRARSLSEYLASPCSQDCQCWEGASGCNGNNNACQAGLVCNASNQCAKSGGGGGGGTGTSSRSFRSFHGTYLSAWTDRTVRLMSKADTWERFSMESAGNGKVYLRSFHGTYLSAWPDRVQLMTHAQAWEQWTPVQNSDGSVSFLSFHGTYLSAWTDGSVRLMRHNKSWEHWF